MTRSAGSDEIIVPAMVINPVWLLPVLAIVVSLIGPMRVSLRPKFLQERVVVAWTALDVVAVEDFGGRRSAVAVKTVATARRNPANSIACGTSIG
jgi:hypothetical protein